MIDIGAGTMDLLWYDSETGEHFKAVAPSPVRTISWEIQKTRGPLAITGVEMGGGVSTAIKERARNAEVVMTALAAATLDNNPDKVRAMGIRLASEETVAAYLTEHTNYAKIVLGDIQPKTLRTIIAGLGLPLHFDAVALCAQDHGAAPVGVSHLDFRHMLYKNLLEPSPQLHRLLFRNDEIPQAFTRLASISTGASYLDTNEVFVMDSGIAAIVGASQDVQLKDRDPVMVLDIATSHTVVAVLSGGQPAGFVEYHTRDLSLSRLEELMVDLADGRVDHSVVVSQGGHGAWLRNAVGFSNVKAILATGPKRYLLAESRLPIIWGAPWGDNMMTGTVGLLEALRLRKGLEPIGYL